MEMVEAKGLDVDVMTRTAFGMLLVIKENGAVHRDLLCAGVQMNTGMSEDQINVIEYTLLQTGLCERLGFTLSLTPDGVKFLEVLKNL